jgi:hypothetical protein
MNERDLERAVRAWVAEGSEQLPDRYLDAALDEIAATPQRRTVRQLRIFPVLEGSWLPTTAAVVTVVAAAIMVLMLLPRGGIGPSGASPSAEPTPVVTPTPAPTPIPTPVQTTLAVGQFDAPFGSVAIAAIGSAPQDSGSAANVSGSMEVTGSPGEAFTVDLACARSEPDGILLIGGPVTESTHPQVIVGTRAAIIFRAGDPVMATLWFEGDTTLARTCSAFLRRAQDTGDYLAPIDGTLELAR